MAAMRTEERRSISRSMLSLEQMLEGKTSLKTQKLTHKNIICVGTNILNEIEAFMTSDKTAAIQKAIEETEERMLKERQQVIDEIIGNLMNEHNEELEKAKKHAEEEIAVVKYRCEVAEKKRSRMAQEKFLAEKEDALRKAAEEAREMKIQAVKLAEEQLREKMLIENAEYTKNAVEKTRVEMKKEGDVRVKKAIANTKEFCERTAAKHLSNVEKRYKEEIRLLKLRLEDLTSALRNQRNEKEEFERLFTELKEDYKRFQNYTQGFCSDYLLK